MAAVTASLIVAGVGLAGQMVGNGIAAKRAKDAEGRYLEQAEMYAGELKEARANRPEITNPYGEVTNAFENIQNPFAGMTNTFANLGVATQAAEFQAEQADIALANSLDTMMKTGMGSGGATALAQAALQSKKGISADIQQQESQNQKLSAKGAMDVATMKAEGQQRADQLKGEGAMKAAELQGRGAEFEMTQLENRSIADMGFAAGMMQNNQQNAADANAARSQAFVDMGAAFGSTLGSVASFGLKQ